MKTLFTLAFVCIGLLLSTANAGSKYAVATGTWESTSTWSLTRGGASGAAVPNATDTVWIPSPYVVTITASAKACYNLIVESGGALLSNQVNPTSSQQYIRVSGDSVVNNGVIGYDPATPSSLTAICFESYVAGKTVTFKGSGVSKISRIRNGNNVSNTTVVIDQDMTLTYTGSTGTGGICWYGFQGAASGNALKINAGRTVNFLDYGYIGTNSSVDTDGPTTTIQVDGSLLMTGTNCTLSLRPSAGSTVSLIVNGTVEIGRTLKPTGTTGVPSVITVNSGGVLKVGTAGGGISYFDVPTQTVTGDGTFQHVGGSMRIGAAAGLDPTNGPIRTTTRVFSSTARYDYLGTVAQVTGPDLPSSVGGIVVSDSQGVTLTNSLTVTDTTSSISGGCKLLTGARTLTNNGRFTVNGSFQIDEGGWATGANDFIYGTNGTLVFNTTSNYGINNDPPRYWPSSISNVTVQNAGGITLNVPRTVTGLFQTSTGVSNSFGNDLTVSGSVQLNTGGYFANFSPTYSGTGTLVYNTGGTYGMFNEWGAGTVIGYGVPQNVTIQNATTVTLAGARSILGTLSIPSGHLDLNGNTLTLDPAATLSETAGNTVIGTSGVITTTRSLNAPAGTDIGGLGISITSAADLGSTVISRGHAAQAGGGNNSIKRYYDVTPTNNTGLNATLAFHYDDSEFNGIPENRFQMFKSTDGGASWSGVACTVFMTDNIITVDGQNDLSRWTVGDFNAPLPIQLSSFTATMLDRGVRLDWMTISELNNYGFHVQRRSNSESPWRRISASLIPGNGTTNTPHRYSFVDTAPSSRTTQYRLEQIDLDGTIHFTEPIEIVGATSVVETAPREFGLKQNYPNPFNPSTEVKFSVENTARTTLEVFNLLGERVATVFDEIAEAGRYYQVRLDAANLSSGTYLYRLQSGDKTQSKRMLVLK